MRIDGRGYKAYKDIRGAYRATTHSLHIDHVQGDPFAEPSKLRVRVPQQVAAIPKGLHSNRVRRIALQDVLTREFADVVQRTRSRSRGSGKSGLILVDTGRQEVLERTSCLVTEGFVEIRLQVGLPAAGRSVLGREAERLLTEVLLQLVEQSLLWANLPQGDIARFVDCVENQEHVRAQLAEMNAVAFVADGSNLPRADGVSDRPMAVDRSTLFGSPKSLRVMMPLLHEIDWDGHRVSSLSGMAIPAGVTLIVGGGYHGKSTLLKAIERGVYPHVPGDGREYVVTRGDAVKIRAEDGRRVERTDISAFINNLPQKRSTLSFCSDDASGSTSQAANITEALESGSRLLLLDEDTCATNFMMRDARMQELVRREQEPITPFVDRVREMYNAARMSTVLVMGGCGDYFDAADTVIQMTEFVPADVTEKAKCIAAQHATGRCVEAVTPWGLGSRRVPLRSGFDASRGRRDVKIQTRGPDKIVFGRHDIDLRAVEQIVDPSQTGAIAMAIHYASQHLVDDERSLPDILDRLEDILTHEGLDVLDPWCRDGEHPGNLARFRRYELAAAMNRLRTLTIASNR